jgi:hypothetical protein
MKLTKYGAIEINGVVENKYSFWYSSLKVGEEGELPILRAKY